MKRAKEQMTDEMAVVLLSDAPDGLFASHADLPGRCQRTHGCCGASRAASHQRAAARAWRSACG